ncbi:MAG TPA: S9 family peptidase [Gammaproteobacteria bacterium]|nr:S9 family peptidase [Gammaproteobacteria bacterium]
MKRLLCAAFPLYLLLTAAAAMAAPSPVFKLTDLRRLVHLSDAQISPDGRQIALVVARADWKNDKSKSEIDLVDAQTGKSRRLTYGRDGVSSPRWSPDGSRLAFLAKDPDTRQPQVYVMPMNGGDAQCVTDNKQGVDEFAWSPDGRQIAFMAEDAPKDKKALKHHEDWFKVTDNNYMTRAAVQPWHLWVVAADGGKARRLTHGDWSVQTDQDTASPLVWSPDGKSVLFTKFPDSYFGNAYRSTIAAVNVADGKLHTVIDATGAGVPVFAPRSGVLAFMRPRDGDQNNGNAVYVAQHGESRDATHALAHNINDFAWLPDGKTLLLAGDAGTESVFWTQPLDGHAHMLDLGDLNPNASVSVSHDGEIAFIASTPNHPDELYVMHIGAKPHRLTDLNGFVDDVKLGRSTGIDWQGPDGFKEDGVLTYPVDYRQGRKYPLVLLIHGGPEGASVTRFDPLRQLLAAQGFLVFQPNYRGSINLGDKYQHAIYRDTGEGPGKDVMAGLDAVKKLGVVDTSRIGVSGWSYGGYMTSWLNGRYPDVWKAAIEGAALNDWVMDYTIAFYQKGDLYFFGGSPWTKKYHDIWREQSPIRLAPNVKAPTLIMGDAGDPNVPIVNSYEMYHALRDNGVHTEFYVYPADTHFPHDIVRQTDVYRRWVDWMVTYLK